jgi:L-lactate dehydrogenase complex protein LldG
VPAVDVGDADARAEILARVRTALGHRPPQPVEVPRNYRHRGDHPPGAAAVLDLFEDRLTDYHARVLRTGPDGLAAAVAEAVPVGARFVVPPGLADGWAPPGAVVDDGTLTADALDRVDGVLTGCTAAAAETGTIALDGSAGQGRRALSLVPDRHVCVVHADQVVQTVPELLARLDPRRPITLISGPSATSDIELQRVEGVHGPRTLIVILVSH